MSGQASLRAALDRIDRELASLVVQRAELARRYCDQIAQGSDVDWTACREALRVLEGHPDGEKSRPVLERVFREIESGCQNLVRPLRVVYLGPDYSYSHVAGLARFGRSAEYLPVANVEAAFREVAAQRTDVAVVPLENSTDGRIVDSLGMFVRIPVRITAEISLRVHHCLLGCGERGHVERIISKPQAFSQCRQWLSDNLPHATLVDAASTAAAAALAAGDPRAAAIASRQAARAYGLAILVENIEDNDQNVTRFAVIGGQPGARTGNDKTAVLFQLPHAPGALADAMTIFKKNRLNLTWIESFPFRGSSAKQEYLFFLEFDGHQRDLKARRAVAALAKRTDRLDVLGSYAKSEPMD